MTTTNGLTDEIIKVDTRGRMRTTRERREALLTEFDRSGMSGQKFAAWAGIKYPTWANWVQQRRKKQGQVSSAPNQMKLGEDGANNVRWLEAVVSRASTQKATVKSNTGALVVQGAGGVRIEITDEAQVKLAAQLLRELGWKPGC